MTSLILRDTDLVIREEEEALSYFFSLCERNEIIPLDRWLKLNNFSYSLLLHAGLMEFNDSLIVSIKPYCNLTKEGRFFIDDTYSDCRVTQKYRLWTIKCPDELFKFLDLAKSNSGVSDSTLLLKFIAEEYGDVSKNSSSDLLNDNSVFSGPYCILKDYEGIALEHRERKSCAWCGMCLAIKPVFILEDQVICFRCQSIAFFKLKLASNLLNKRLCEEAEASVIQHNEWSLGLWKHINNKGLLVRVKEIFGQSKKIYIDEYCHKKIEPEIVEYVPKSPTVCLFVDNTFLKAKSIISVKKRDNYTCQLCLQDRELLGRVKLEVHHIIPKAKNGKDYYGNLITLCQICHDNQSWFNHKRAYAKYLDDYVDCDWEFDLTPDILSLNEFDLINRSSLFLGESFSYGEKSG